MSFERFAFAILLVYFQNCEIFAPSSLLRDGEVSSKSSNESVSFSSSSSSSSSFQKPGAGFGLEMLLMQTMRKWRTLNEFDVIRIVIRPALCLIPLLPNSNSVEKLRRKFRTDVRMDLALDRNPKLKIQYSQAQTLRDELKHQRLMLTRPLLSSSGTVFFFYSLPLSLNIFATSTSCFLRAGRETSARARNARRVPRDVPRSYSAKSSRVS